MEMRMPILNVQFEVIGRARESSPMPQAWKQMPLLLKDVKQGDLGFHFSDVAASGTNLA